MEANPPNQFFFFFFFFGGGGDYEDECTNTGNTVYKTLFTYKLISTLFISSQS